MFLDGRPFELGETLKGTDDDGNYINGEILGKVFAFPAQTSGISTMRGQRRRRTGRHVWAVALRNLSGGALSARDVVSGHPTAPTDFATSGYYNPLIEAVDGTSGTAVEPFCYVVDEFLPSGGVANKDIFWGIVRGPCSVTLNSGAVNIAIGDPLTSDGNGVLREHVTGTDAAEGVMGYALEATTTASDTILAYLTCPWF